MADLSGKIAVITGGTSGIGLAAAKNFIEHGAKVVIAGRSLSGADVAKSLGDEETVRFFQTDVSKEDDVKALMEYTVGVFGRVDIAVASAGVSGFTLEMYDSKVWQDTININLSGAFYTIKYAVEQMRKQGGGSIVVVGSAASIVGNMGTVCYPAAKHGVAGLVKSAAINHIREGIRINGVVPGFIATPLTDAIPADDFARNVAGVPIGRVGQPEEIATAINFLASDEASYVVGSMMVIDGGYTVQ